MATETKPSIKNLMKALGKFQAKCMSIKKDSTNPHFKSKYASLSAILDVIQPVLTECDLVFTQVPDGNESLMTMLYHTESGESIEAPYKLNAVQVTPQGVGSAITYARRYALSAILGLNIDDDDDGNEASRQNKPQQQPQPKQQAPAPQQPQPTQSIFTKKYRTGHEIADVAVNAKIKAELVQLYNANKQLIDSDEALQKYIGELRTKIDSGSKTIITDAQFAAVLDRVAGGDVEAIGKAVNAFLMNENQLKMLNDLKAVNERIAIKFTQEADIATVIDLCYTEAQIMKVHQNNFMIIDRTPELITKLNAKLATIKKRAA